MAIGEVFPLPLERLLPSQARYSSKNVEDKIINALHKAYISEPAPGTFKLYFDEGRSLYPSNQGLPVIDLNNGSYLLIDGHHSILASKQVGATTAFVRVVEIAEHYPSQAFWAAMEEKGLTYLRNLGGEPCPPPTSFDDLMDDPVRYFVTLARCKVDESLNIKKARGYSYPLWLKIGKDVPFVEFKIADHLYKHGFRVDYAEMENPNRFESLVEQARTLLGQHPLPTFRMIYRRERFETSAEIQAYLQDFK